MGSMENRDFFYPTEIFTFSKKSQYPGKTPGQILFTTINGWDDLQHKLQIIENHYQGKKEINRYHRYLLWFLETIKKIEEIGGKEICTKCGQRKAKYIPIWVNSEDLQYDLSMICCEDCKKELSYNYSFLEISLHNLIRLHIRHKKSEKQILKFLKQQFDLPERLTKKEIFKWLSEKSQNFETKKYTTLTKKGEYIIDFSQF